MSHLASTGIHKKDLMASISPQAEEQLLTRLSGLADGISAHLDSLKAAAEIAEAMEEPLEAAHYCHDVIIPEMNAIRRLADTAEGLIPDDMLPYPTYAKLLFNL